MKAKVMKTAATDRLIVARSDALLKYTDRDDLRCREAEDILDAYHADWFHEFDGDKYFTPPAGYISDGTIRFINGRHRTLVLARHLKQFPFLVGNLDLDHVGMMPSEKSRRVLDAITVSGIAEHSAVCLPDLGYGDFDPA